MKLTIFVIAILCLAAVTQAKHHHRKRSSKLSSRNRFAERKVAFKFAKNRFAERKAFKLSKNVIKHKEIDSGLCEWYAD